MGRLTGRLLLAGALAVAATTVGPLAPIAPASAACTISTTYRQGMRGTGVNCIESRLKALGYQ